MLKIINLNCPENSIFKIKFFKLLSKIDFEDKFIITFIIDYDIKQLQMIEKNLDLFDSSFKRKYKIAEFNIISDSVNNECGGKERLALVLSNVRSLKNSINFVKDINDLKEVYNIYRIKSNFKIKIENW